MSVDQNMNQSSVTNNTPKPPREILGGIYAFPPNRETLGGTSYLILGKDGNILVDCPGWNETQKSFLSDLGGVRWLFITHRDGMSQVGKIQNDLGCEVVIQEQEAYLLPNVTVTPFAEEITLGEGTGIWTCGYSPGASCLYVPFHGGVLFSGRHLLTDSEGKLAPIFTRKTFHWRRQLRNVEKLQKKFPPERLGYVCPGANTGFLRGKGAVEGEQLAQI
ncbi:MBL fold metallo-hydrolase [Dactylococcopsis salina]|uniref:Zn-dependent hydrolase, glyoxylase n=1 Tax=Dactylococcopsis salina (strain PCC 8305) TaxID=13035 RepID=K9YU67_DACS8|nr:Zn-dependent hydrolase [Dactylococcopsis salina]AFZ49890.1 Zn-dependent hydrolase, glyoxylase [Dactylococcopsis salina PCC 8305]